ncbi:hypothetical protein GYB60_01420, partial [bacterium]|nr:hypothetical protein [bacterium]
PALPPPAYKPNNLARCTLRLSLDLNHSRADETFAFDKRPKQVSEGTEWDDSAPKVARVAKEADFDPATVHQIAEAITSLASHKNPGEVNKVTIAVMRGDRDTVEALLPPDVAVALLGQPA